MHRNIFTTQKKNQAVCHLFNLFVDTILLHKHVHDLLSKIEIKTIMKQFLSFSLLLILSASISAQDLNELWHHKDLSSDNIPGVSLKQAKDYLDGRPSKKVVVAIIDSGYELDHDAFQTNTWVNKGEIAGNGKDDDGNGYIDDVNGWNFIGGPEGNVINETMELTREYRRLKAKYENVSTGKSAEYKYWREIEERYLADSEEAIGSAKGFFDRYNGVAFQYKLLAGYAMVDTLSMEALESIDSQDSVVMAADNYFTRIMGYLGGKASLEDVLSVFEGGLAYYDYQGNYAYNDEFDPRDIVGDDPTDFRNRNYGNNRIDEVGGFGGSHGTHVAGIVGGKVGETTIGITDNVEFMFVRAIPSGDERDKDVGNAIRYAADNGAQVINMSFGKDYSPNKEYVWEAVKYAESKGVLMVHAAGNDGKNNDENPSFPDGSITKSKKSKNWIEVGASSENYNEDLAAGFSNYGRKNVDLFAPGVQIMSAVPENTYKANSGTSMAAPVVAGVSALLLSYFPDLEASEVKEILLQSATKVDLDVTKPGSEDLINFSKLSKTGGIVNAYEAVKLADQRFKIESR